MKGKFVISPLLLGLLFIWAVIAKEGYAPSVLSVLGWIYHNMIDPMCHGIMLLIRYFS